MHIALLYYGCAGDLFKILAGFESTFLKGHTYKFFVALDFKNLARVDLFGSDNVEQMQFSHIPLPCPTVHDIKSKLGDKLGGLYIMEENSTDAIECKKGEIEYDKKEAHLMQYAKESGNCPVVKVGGDRVYRHAFCGRKAGELVTNPQDFDVVIKCRDKITFSSDIDWTTILKLSQTQVTTMKDFWFAGPPAKILNIVRVYPELVGTIGCCIKGINVISPERQSILTIQYLGYQVIVIQHKLTLKLSKDTPSSYISLPKGATLVNYYCFDVVPTQFLTEEVLLITTEFKQ
jgi:hypothetical protein